MQNVLFKLHIEGKVKSELSADLSPIKNQLKKQI